MIKLLVKVKPGSGKDEISVDAENNFSIKIKAKPIDGEANKYIVKYLSKEFNISKGNIQIEKGATSRLKRIALSIEQSVLDELVKKYKK
jgi:uncharacterized protein (TIGR00251 family)